MAAVLSIAAGWSVHPLLVVAQGVLPLVGIAAMLAVIVPLLNRQYLALALAVPATISSIWMVAPTMAANDAPQWAGDADTFSVYSAIMMRKNWALTEAFDAADAPRDGNVLFTRLPTVRTSVVAAVRR